MPRRKKGFALQFNWIFVLIGGAVFLSFFFSLINNAIRGDEVRKNTDATQMIDTAFKVSMGSDNIESTSIFDKKLVFRCGDISEYFVIGTLKSGRYDFNAIFSQQELSGRTLLIKTLDFRIPFKIMPLVYVTNKEVEYVFVGNFPFQQQVMTLLPENATKKFIPSGLGSVQAYSNNHYLQTVFIVNTTEELVGGAPNFQSSDDYSKVFVVVVSPDEPGAQYGELKFFTLGSDGFFIYNGTSMFIGANLILGGIISHDKSMYDCNLKKVMQRIAHLSELYRQRLEYYSTQAETFCSPYYTQASTALAGIKSSAEAENPSLDDYKAMAQAIDGLEALNSYILAEPSGICGRIY